MVIITNQEGVQALFFIIDGKDGVILQGNDMMMLLWKVEQAFICHSQSSIRTCMIHPYNWDSTWGLNTCLPVFENLRWYIIEKPML